MDYSTPVFPVGSVYWTGKQGERRVAFCPNCADEIAIDAASCSACGAIFGSDSAWKPLTEAASAQPHETPPVVDVLAKMLLAGVCVFLLILGQAVIPGGYGDTKALLWRTALTAFTVATILVAAVARLRWMLMMLLGSFTLFFTSCAVHFHWG
jgi:hypothetical protein